MLVSRTGAATEVPRCNGQRTVMAFLGCSKCYELANQWGSWSRAVGSGMQARVGRLVFDMYTQDRHARAHRGSGETEQGQPWVGYRVCLREE